MKSTIEQYAQVQAMKQEALLAELNYLRQYVEFGIKFLTRESGMSPREVQEALNRWDRMYAEVEKIA